MIVNQQFGFDLNRSIDPNDIATKTRICYGSFDRVYLAHPCLGAPLFLIAAHRHWASFHWPPIRRKIISWVGRLGPIWITTESWSPSAAATLKVRAGGRANGAELMTAKPGIARHPRKTVPPQSRVAAALCAMARLARAPSYPARPQNPFSERPKENFPVCVPACHSRRILPRLFGCNRKKRGLGCAAGHLRFQTLILPARARQFIALPRQLTHLIAQFQQLRRNHSRRFWLRDGRSIVGWRWLRLMLPFLLIAQFLQSRVLHKRAAKQCQADRDERAEDDGLSIH
jgi:hypothetical protein